MNLNLIQRATIGLGTVVFCLAGIMFMTSQASLVMVLIFWNMVTVWTVGFTLILHTPPKDKPAEKELVVLNDPSPRSGSSSRWKLPPVRGRRK